MLVLSLCLFLLYAGNSLCFPFMAIYLTGHRGVGAAWVGFYLSLCMAANGAGHVLGGTLSDRYGRKAVMTGALAARTLLLAALAAAVTRGSVAVIVSTQIAYNLLGGFFEPASRSWVADRTPPVKRLRAYGLLRIAPNLGWAAGPALGALCPLEQYGRLFLVSAAVTLGCVFLLAFALDDSRLPLEAERPELTLPPDARFLHYCFWTAAISLVMAQLVVSLSIHATRYVGLTPRQVGLLFTVNGLVVVLLQTSASAAFAGTRLTRSLALGSLLYALGFGWVGWAGGFAALAGAMVVITLGEIIVAPSLTALAANMAPPRSRGRYMGAHGLAYQVGLAAGPLSGGWALDRLAPGGPWRPWAAIAAAGAVSAAGFLSLSRRLTREEDLPS